MNAVVAPNAYVPCRLKPFPIRIPMALFNLRGGGNRQEDGQSET